MGPTWLGRQIFPVRAYLVDGLLIDAGPPSDRPLLARFLAEKAKDLGIEQVVFTHHHEDHAGNVGLLQQALALTPWAHPEAGRLLKRLPRIPTYRRLVWGSGQDGQTQPLGAVLETPKHRFQVLHTPGHALDHIVLVEPEQGWLFSGDLYVSDQHKLLRPEEDPHQWIDSLGLAAGQDFDTLFCAHRGVVAQGQAALLRKRDRMATLREQVLSLHAKGQSPQAITQALLGREDLLFYASLGDFARLNLVKAFLPGWPGATPMPPARP